MYTLVHAVVGYYVLLLVVRILSRRPGAQFTPFEFVIVFLVGGVIIAATVGDDRSITNCVCAIIAIGLMHRLTAGFRSKSRAIGKALDGVPLVLLNRGQWHEEAMTGMRLSDQDVMHSARQKGLTDLSRIRYAILERVGTISILEETAEKQEAEEKRQTDARDGQSGS